MIIGCVAFLDSPHSHLIQYSEVINSIGLISSVIKRFSISTFYSLHGSHTHPPPSTLTLKSDTFFPNLLICTLASQRAICCMKTKYSIFKSLNKTM